MSTRQELFKHFLSIQIVNLKYEEIKISGQGH